MSAFPTEPTGASSQSRAAAELRTGESLAALLPAGLCMAWLVSEAQWFWRTTPDLSFGWVVVPLCAFVLWEAWPTRPPAVVKGGSAMAFGAGLGLLIVLFSHAVRGALGLTPAAMGSLAVGLLLLAASNLLYVFGWAGVRHFGFGFAFILIAMPLPGVVHYPVVVGLQTMVSSITVELLSLVGTPAQRVANVIHLPNGTVGIDEACSGIRSLQSTVMATLFIGYLTLRRFWLQALLFGAGISLAIVGNVGRSLFLSLMANAHGVKSIDRYHDTAGWSILLFTACGVALLAWLLSRLQNLLGSESTGVIYRGQPLKLKSGSALKC